MFRGASRLFRHMPKLSASVATEVKLVTVDGVGTAFDKNANSATLSIIDAFAHRGMHVTLEDVGKFAGYPILARIERLLNEKGVKHQYLSKNGLCPNYEVVQDLYHLYLHYQQNNLLIYSKPTEGFVDFYQFLKERNIPIVLNTMYSRGEVDVLEEDFERNYGITFSAAITGSDVSNHRPFPESLHRAFHTVPAPDRLLVNSGEMLVVSNEPIGIQAAKNGGYPSVGVTNNHPHNESRLIQHGAAFVVPSLAGAPGVIDDYNKYLLSLANPKKEEPAFMCS